jgi:hypothetical protein
MTIPSSAYQIDVDGSGNLGIFDLSSGSELAYFTSSGGLSVSGEISGGSYNLSGGTGISFSGITITNTGVTSLQGDTGSLSLTSGDGISISGLSIAMSGSYSGTFSASTLKGTFDGGINIQTLNGNDITATSSSGIAILTPLSGGNSLFYNNTGANIYFVAYGSSTVGSVGGGTIYGNSANMVVGVLDYNAGAIVAYSVSITSDIIILWGLAI